MAAIAIAALGLHAVERLPRRIAVIAAVIAYGLLYASLASLAGLSG